MVTKHRMGSLLLVGALTVFAWACASNSLAVKSLGPSDLARLAGTWQGTGRGLLAEDRTITVTLNADGTFTTTGTVYATQGSVEVKDGGLLFKGGFQAQGDQAPNYVATAMLLEERATGQVVEILSGSGFSNSRSVTFMVSRPKP